MENDLQAMRLPHKERSQWLRALREIKRDCISGMLSLQNMQGFAPAEPWGHATACLLMERALELVRTKN